jgi:hypothetical protein
MDMHELEEIMKNMSIAHILQKLIDAGWHTKKFGHMKVIAANPFYNNFGLSISGFWIQPGILQNGYSLFIYPSEELLSVLR